MSSRSRNGDSRGHGDRDSSAGSCKVYVGDLPHEATERDVERAFNDFGALKSVWVARRPPGFAFVEFNTDRDAARAIREIDGTMICGGRVKVALSNGKVRPKPWLRGGSGGGDRFERRGGPPRDRGSSRGGYGSRGEDRGRGRDRDRGRDRGDDGNGDREHASRRDSCNYCGQSDHASWECRNTLRNRKSRSRSPNNDRERRRRKEDSRSPPAEKSRSRSRSRSNDSKDKAPPARKNGKSEPSATLKSKHSRSDDEDSQPPVRKRKESVHSDDKAADSYVDEDTQ